MTTYQITGVTKDKAGAALGACDVYLFKYDAAGNTLTQKAHVVSDGSGNYSITGIVDNEAKYLVTFFKDGSPGVFDASDHTLTPILTPGVSLPSGMGSCGNWSANNCSVDGSNWVTTVPDQGPQGNALTPEASHVLLVPTAINGKPAFYFDYHTDSFTGGYLRTIGLPINMGTENPGHVSWGLVVTVEAIDEYYASIFSTIGTAGHSNYSGGPGDFSLMENNNLIEWTFFAAYTGQVVTWDTPFRIIYVHDGTTSRIYVNGVETGTSWSNTILCSATTELVLGKGILNGSPNGGHNCWVSQLVLDNFSYSTQQIADLDAYLVSQWGF